ncbi:hypothetical protein KSP39_PZI000081 [Platanthera zijinensis]|uniref:Uncharacterized protein n=1 Tax=Platanthera zijinensis TaxID=2320716 RepID=A0AAP0GG18_9ASPA
MTLVLGFLVFSARDLLRLADDSHRLNLYQKQFCMKTQAIVQRRQYLRPCLKYLVENGEVKVGDWRTWATCLRGLCGQEWRTARSAELLQTAYPLAARAVCSRGLCEQKRWSARSAYAQHAVGSQKVTGRIATLSVESDKKQTGLELDRPAWLKPWSSSGAASRSCRGRQSVQTVAGVRQVRRTGFSVRQ